MTVLLEQYWWVLVIALLIGVAVAWAIFGRATKTRVETTISPDVLDEGAAPARRNQALIDAPPATQAAKPHTPSAAPVQTTEPQPAPPPPVPPVPAPETAPAQPAAPQAAASTGAGDDLTRIKGLGPKLSQLLQSLGITRFDQIAAWSDSDIDRIDAQLGKFQGRIRRDNWVEQAGYLAKGDTAGFEGRFGKI
ncbi:hypothetical protein [Caenibius sp. WL]|uniref:hypothetical protein n=1 Tax=Caenibius sp. WL TaxID=2872646 RepID=UPI001C98F1E6|nr:hypothetical protein [Caenibius sp. WL]QZP07456.1 hypothetical protein K5X80_12355 [Caenibius sp. WL]